ncbi:hypothetical protein TNCV_347731 [Trichonephila clavipes]|nr:hypothetical protein TNCV_347731 [Trichonephila clavipes]
MLSDEKKLNYRESFLKCDNLKYLETENSDVIALFAFVPNVTTLKIQGFSGLTDYVVSQLNKTLFKLEFFLLSKSRIYSEADHKRIYVLGETLETNPSKSVLTFASVKNFIEKRKNTMKELDISTLYLSPEDVLTISNINGLKLENVLFPPDLPSSFIKKFCENQLSLTSLQLTSLLHVTDDTIHALCKCFPILKKLVIKQNCVIDKSIVEIFQLEHLEVLDLENSKAISPLNYLKAVFKLKAFKLKELNLAFAQISDDGLCELLMHNLNIRHLNISHTSVSNETLNMISRKLINLEILELESCREISDPGITGELEYYSDSLTPTPLSNLKKLKKLDISCNSLITNNGCMKAIKLPNLKCLLLVECNNLFFHNDLEIILEKQNPRLRNFVISANTRKYLRLEDFCGYRL